MKAANGESRVDLWPYRTAVDPIAASFRLQLARDGWSGLVSADNEVLDGIRTVASLLAAERLKFVDGAAPELLRGMSGYVWDDKQQKLGIAAPVKVDDHGPDALRYGVMAARSTWRGWDLAAA